MSRAATISIVIPVLDDAEELAGLLHALRDVDACEVIVVDGGSRDDSVAVGRIAATRVLAGERGRARQQNHGAAAAVGEVLLFLHADSRPPTGAIDAIRAALTTPDTLGGAFDMAIRADGWRWTLLARAASLRARITRVPYGDQAIFVRRTVFERLGGFPEIPAFEDVAFSRALKRNGRTVQIRRPVTSSARRWQREGIAFTVLRNWLVSLLFVAGVPAERLMRWYPKVR